MSTEACLNFSDLSLTWYAIEGMSFLGLDVDQCIVCISEALVWPQSSCGVCLQILKSYAFRIP